MPDSQSEFDAAKTNDNGYGVEAGDLLWTFDPNYQSPQVSNLPSKFYEINKKNVYSNTLYKQGTLNTMEFPITQVIVIHYLLRILKGNYFY